MITTRNIHFLICLLYCGITFAQEGGYHKRLKIKNPAGAEVFSVKFYEEKIKIEIPGTTLEARIKTKDGKRKYEVAEKVVAEVKYSDDGFKLRSPDGKLLWKVKLRDDEVVIADNEEMMSPWRIAGSGKKLKLSEDGAVVAEVKWYPDTGKLKLKSMNGSELFAAKTKGISSAIALLHVPRMSQVERSVLMAELEVADR